MVRRVSEDDDVDGMGNNNDDMVEEKQMQKVDEEDE